MKKIILLAGIIITLITSCSTDDLNTYHNETDKNKGQKDFNDNVCWTCRDTISRNNDTINIDPVKPDKPTN